MSLNNISANLRKAFIEYMKELEQTEENNTDESSSNVNPVNSKTDFDNDASIFSKYMNEFKEFAKQAFTKMNLSKKDIEYVVDILAGNSTKGDETKIDEADEKVDEKVKEMSETKNTDNSATNTTETNTSETNTTNNENTTTTTNNKEAKETTEETSTNKSDSTNNTSNTDSSKTTTDTSTNTTNTNTTTDSSTTNTSNTTDTSNTNTTTDSSTTSSAINKEVENLLTDIFKDTKALASLDSDIDGKLSEEEKNKFKEYVKGKNNEITLENLNKAYDLIKNGKFDYNTPLDEITDTTNSATNTTNTANTTDTSNNSSADSASDSADSTSGSSGSSSSSGASGPSSSSGSSGDYSPSSASSSDGVDSSADTQNSEDLTNMSVDDLKTKRDTEIAPSVETAKSDLEKAKKVLFEVAKNSPYITEDGKKNINIFVSALAESEITMGLRFNVPVKDYWPARWKTLEDTRNALREATHVQ